MFLWIQIGWYQYEVINIITCFASNYQKVDLMFVVNNSDVFFALEWLQLNWNFYSFRNNSFTFFVRNFTSYDTYGSVNFAANFHFKRFVNNFFYRY